MTILLEISFALALSLVVIWISDSLANGSTSPKKKPGEKK
jgi:hypothetical protein